MSLFLQYSINFTSYIASAFAYNHNNIIVKQQRNKKNDTELLQHCNIQKCNSKNSTIDDDEKQCHCPLNVYNSVIFQSSILYSTRSQRQQCSCFLLLRECVFQFHVLMSKMYHKSIE